VKTYIHTYHLLLLLLLLMGDSNNSRLLQALKEFRTRQASSGDVCTTIAHERQLRLQRTHNVDSSDDDDAKKKKKKILIIKTKPLGARIKAVVDYLKTAGRDTYRTSEQIFQAIGCDISTDAQLAESLAKNPKIVVAQAGRHSQYAYRPESSVRNKEELMELVRHANTPVAVSFVSDAYENVLHDIVALEKHGMLMSIHSTDPSVSGNLLFAIDQDLAGVCVDTDVASLWKKAGTLLPQDDDGVRRSLKSLGMDPAPRSKVSTVPPEQSKTKRSSVIVTNAHVSHLL
jgi:arsenate reductase-like glutaredoxin family protein